MSYIFPIYAPDATQAVTLTATTKEIEITGRTVNITVAASTTAVATLASVPVGLVFTLDGTNVNATGSASATITTKAGKTIELTNGEIVTLMALENDGFTVMDAKGAEGVTNTAGGTLFS
jgi:hypothetical protein